MSIFSIYCVNSADTNPIERNTLYNDFCYVFSSVFSSSDVKTLFFAFIGAFAAYYFGMRQYLVQGRCDHNRQLYFEDGLIKFISDVDLALNCQAMNWARSLQILKMYRDSNCSTDRSYFERGFSDVEIIPFGTDVHYRMKRLFGSDIQWSIYQLLLAKVREYSDLVRDDFYAAVCFSSEGKTNFSLKEIIEKYECKISEMHSKMRIYYDFMSSLQRIVQGIERKTFNNAFIDECPKMEVMLNEVSIMKDILKKIEEEAD